jgi:molybdopterin molybdotransferase
MSVEDATSHVLEGVFRLPPEVLHLKDAAYRVLAEPLQALRTQPPFPSAAMDGYAINSQSAANIYEVVGESAAGKRFGGAILHHQAVRIFTGAPVPDGADVVVMQEDVERLDGNRISISAVPQTGRHIRKRGLDFSEDQEVLPAGRILDPAALSLAAAAGHPQVPVIRKPVVAIIATGNELVLPGTVTGPDQIVASNGFGIGAFAQKLGADVHDYGIVPDDAVLIRKTVEKALAQDADIIVTLGGASVGDHDLIQPVLAELGIPLGFWKIAMRPGKPLMYGRTGSTHILGLPGNPVSSLVCGQLFLAPLLSALAGRPFSHDIRTAILTTPMRENDQRQDYVRASTQNTAQSLLVSPFALQDSSMLTTLASATALIIRPPFAPALEAGAIVQVMMLR